MRARLVVVLVTIAASLPAGANRVWAADGGGQNTWANAQASGGQLTIQAGWTHWTPPAGSAWAQEANSDSPPGKVNPNQPYGCTYVDGPDSPGGAPSDHPRRRSSSRHLGGMPIPWPRRLTALGPPPPSISSQWEGVPRIRELLILSLGSPACRLVSIANELGRFDPLRGHPVMPGTAGRPRSD